MVEASVFAVIKEVSVGFPPKGWRQVLTQTVPVPYEKWLKSGPVRRLDIVASQGDDVGSDAE